MIPFDGVEGESSGEDGIGLSDRLPKLGKMSNRRFLDFASAYIPLGDLNAFFSVSVCSNVTVGACVVRDGSGCSGAVVKDDTIEADMEVSVVPVDKIDAGGVSRDTSS